METGSIFPKGTGKYARWSNTAVQSEGKSPVCLGEAPLVYLGSCYWDHNFRSTLIKNNSTTYWSCILHLVFHLFYFTDEHIREVRKVPEVTQLVNAGVRIPHSHPTPDLFGFKAFYSPISASRRMCSWHTRHIGGNGPAGSGKETQAEIFE